jgi:hypothetical protein
LIEWKVTLNIRIVAKNYRTRPGSCPLFYWTPS